jgi:hypothetical protein
MTARAAFALALFATLAAHAQSPTRPAKVGDVHVYAVQHKVDKLAFEETVTVTAIEGDRIRTSHVRSDRPEPMEGIYGKDWATYKSGSSGLQMQPPSRALALPLEVGKAWDASYEATTTTGAKLRVKIESKVAAQEKIATPAGEFQAYRVESEGYVSGLSFQGGWGIRQKAWYAPAIDRLVRFEFRELRTLGADNVTELKQFKPAD